jgi:hypothetical protein
MLEHSDFIVVFVFLNIQFELVVFIWNKKRFFLPYPTKNQRWFNVGIQRCFNVYSTLCACWVVISSVEVYDKHIITCHFSYHALYQPSFIYHPLNLSDLGLIKGMIWKMPCNNLCILTDNIQNIKNINKYAMCY